MDESPSTSTSSPNNLDPINGETSSNANPYVWSNRKCIEIAAEKSFPQDVKNLAVQKNIITRFFNFYLGAKVHKHKGVSVSDLVFSTIAIMPLHPATEEFMWGDYNYDDEGSLFYLALEDKLSLEVDKGTKKEEETVKKEAQENTQAVSYDATCEVPSKDNTNNTEENSLQNNKDEMQDHNEVNTNSDAKANESFIEKKVENCATETSTVNKEEERTKSTTNTEEDNAMHVDKDDDNNSQENNNNDNIPKQEGNDKGKPRKFPSSTEIVWLSTKISPPGAKVECKEYGPVENAAFTASVNRFIEVWDSDQEARISLKYFFGFVALTLLRGTTKTFKHLVNAFANVRFVRNLDYIRAFASQTLKYSVPHKRCIKCCYRTFRKRDENLRVMFAKIVFQSFILRRMSMEAQESGKDPFPPNIMYVTVLTHTSSYGLGLISMIENLAKRSIYFDLIVETTRCKETEQSWEKITNFFEKYMTKATNETTHFWARVIDDNYFKELSCTENYPLAVILAVFIEKYNADDGTDTGIWQSTWVKKGDNLDAYKEIGQNMYLKYRETTKFSLSKLQLSFVGDTNTDSDLFDTKERM